MAGNVDLHSAPQDERHGRPPLDPEAKAFLDFVESLGRPPNYTQPYREARRVVRESSVQLTRPGPQMASVEDLTIVAGCDTINARLYTPSTFAEPAPLLIFFHGGGFVYCDLDTHDGLCRSLAAAGECVVASVEYRLAPEHSFPAAPDDALAATKWFIANANRLKLDPANVVVGGDSAGGNLAAVAAQQIAGLAGQLLLYPWLDMRMGQPSYVQNAEGYMLTLPALIWFRSHYLADLNQRDCPKASPLLSESVDGLPPAFVLTAGYDPLRDDGAEYARRLREANVCVHSSEYGGQIHGFAMMNRMISAADLAVAEAGSWLKQIWATTGE